MKKKRKFSMPSIASSPNTLIVLCGALLGLALILSIEPKGEKFVPSYEENSSQTKTWDENEAVVLVGIVDEETEGTLETVSEITIYPAEEIPETGGDSRNGIPEAETGTEGRTEVPGTDVIVDNRTEPEEDGGKETVHMPEGSEQEDTENKLPDKEENSDTTPDTTPDTDNDTPDEVIHVAENVTKEDKAETKPQEKPKTPDDTKNPDKKPEYGDDVPVAGEPENGNDGKVYDPVFGWITTGEAVSDSIDNDGSLDKQVGTMGK